MTGLDVSLRDRFLYSPVKKSFPTTFQGSNMHLDIPKMSVYAANEYPFLFYAPPKYIWISAARSTYSGPITMAKFSGTSFRNV